MKIKIKLNEVAETPTDKRVIEVSRLEELFRFFHLSSLNLHKNKTTFTFNPRVPRSPYEDDNGHVIEDDFTKRISLSTTIGDAVISIPDADVGTKLYVYACDVESRFDDDIDAIQLSLEFGRCKEELSSAQNPYGQIFNLNKFLKRKKIKNADVIHTPSQLSPKIKSMFTACVPDSYENNEYWSTKDTKMYYIGVYSPPLRHVLLSWQGSKIIDKIEKEESSD